MIEYIGNELWRKAIQWHTGWYYWSQKYYPIEDEL